MLRPLLSRFTHRSPAASEKPRRSRPLVCEPLESRRLLAQMSCGAEAEDDPELCLDPRAELVRRLDGGEDGEDREGGEGGEGEGGHGGGSAGGGQGQPSPDTGGGEGEGGRPKPAPISDPSPGRLPPFAGGPIGGEAPGGNSIRHSPPNSKALIPPPGGDAFPFSRPKELILSWLPAELSELEIGNGSDASRRLHGRISPRGLASPGFTAEGHASGLDAFFQSYSDSDSTFEVLAARLTAGSESANWRKASTNGWDRSLPGDSSLYADELSDESSRWGDSVDRDERPFRCSSADDVMQAAVSDGLMNVRLWRALQGGLEESRGEEQLVARQSILAQLIELSPGSIQAGEHDGADASTGPSRVGSDASGTASSSRSIAAHADGPARRASGDSSTRQSIDLAQRDANEP